MNILSYNIHRCNQSKIDYVLAMGADIMALPECASKGSFVLPDGYNMEWFGSKACLWKGLGVIWKENVRIKRAEWFNDEHKWIMPLIVNDEFILIATWPTIVKGINKTYPQILLEALKEYEPYLRSGKALLCGDFNCFTHQGGVSKSTGTFEQCIDFFYGMGYESLYHGRTGERFGKETTATYYHLFKASQPFFLDYAFTNMPVFAYEIGKWNKNISDHRPQMIVH